MELGNILNRVYAIVTAKMDGREIAVNIKPHYAEMECVNETIAQACAEHYYHTNSVSTMESVHVKWGTSGIRP